MMALSKSERASHFYLFQGFGVILIGTKCKEKEQKVGFGEKYVKLYKEYR